MTAIPPIVPEFVFAGAAHIDRSGWLAAPSVAGCSNPARVEESAGGTSFNVAGILASLGHRPKLFTRLGKDNPSDYLQQLAKARAIDLRAELAENENTGTYTSIIEPDGSLLIAIADMSVYDGFNGSDCIRHIKASVPGGWFVADVNLPQPLIRNLLQNAAGRKAALTVSKAKAPRLRSSLDLVDLLFTNQTEAHSLLGLTSMVHASQLAEGFWKAGVKSAVVSSGKENVLVMEEGKVTTLPVEASNIVVDVTGAGDALAGGTLHGLVRGATLAEAVGFGISTARQIIEVKGAWRPDLTPFDPTPDEMANL